MRETLITVTGNVVDTPQRRRTEQGHSVASFRIASTQRKFDRNDGQWVDGDSLYLKVTCWRALADNVDRSVVQGDPVIITGRLYTRTYEADGQRRSSYELEASGVGLDLSRGVAAFSRTKSGAAPTYEVTGEAGAEPTEAADDRDDDTDEAPAPALT
jgi:single-strand DNA-binding protein